MQVQLISIYSKLNDFKVCCNCKKILWYEREKCFECGAGSFLENVIEVEKKVLEEYKFWQEEEFLSEADADEIYYEV